MASDVSVQPFMCIIVAVERVHGNPARAQQHGPRSARPPRSARGTHDATAGPAQDLNVDGLGFDRLLPGNYIPLGTGEQRDVMESKVLVPIVRV